MSIFKCIIYFVTVSRVSLPLSLVSTLDAGFCHDAKLYEVIIPDILHIDVNFNMHHYFVTIYKSIVYVFGNMEFLTSSDLN